jgi:large subunit ribosomal protein L7/L12
MAKNLDKLIEELANMSVLDAAELADALEKKFGVSAAMPFAPTAAAPAATETPAQSEEQAEYKVTLQEAGPEKIKTIKALRQVVTDLNLTDAKKLVENTPSVIAESVPKDDAKKIKEVLEAAGAKVKFS